jgi:hypothetical protein
MKTHLANNCSANQPAAMTNHIVIHEVKVAVSAAARRRSIETALTSPAALHAARMNAAKHGARF